MRSKDEELIWKRTGEKELLRTPVFTVVEQNETAANGVRGSYIALEAPDCVVVIPEYEGSFVLVRQWRHGAQKLTTEFPGGVIDAGESPEAAAARELSEETGFTAGKLTYLGVCSPNPALFKSRFHCFLAEELVPCGGQHLDRDELISVELMPKEDVISGFGGEEFSHAFMGTALAFYLRGKMNG